MTNPPSCPVTGNPAIRHILWVTTRFLIDSWQTTFGVNASPSFGTVERFGLWESPTGLYFFDPPREGDNAFYNELYARRSARAIWAWKAVWQELELAAARIHAGDRVLDFGCGFASFRHFVPEAQYVGLDPNFADKAAVEGVYNQALSDHLKEHAGSYDVVCAFQVLEHLQSPRDTFSDMVRATRPGGLVMVGVPSIPPAITSIPSFLFNAPPHHLTWWTVPALVALATRCGTTVETIETISESDYDDVISWIERYSPIRCSNAYFYHTRIWRAANLGLSFLSRIVNAVRKTPRPTRKGVGLLLVARRPAVAI